MLLLHKILAFFCFIILELYFPSFEEFILRRRQKCEISSRFFLGWRWNLPVRIRLHIINV